tara:strand:- start:313 stop:720 length:408 start_codon:yes stop_codon:yes gene_type:complete
MHSAGEIVLEADHMLRLATRRLNPRRFHAALLSTSTPPSATPPPKPAKEAKVDDDNDYPIMLVNPRARLADAMPVAMVCALYLAYCGFADVLMPAVAIPDSEEAEDPPAPPDDVLRELPDGRVLMKDGSIRKPGR